MEGAGDEADEEEGRGEELDEVGVSIDDLLRVLSRGDNHVSSHLNRFQPNRRSRDEFREVEYNSPFNFNYFNSKYKEMRNFSI